MNFAYDVTNKRGAGTTWFHEHGHYVDNNAGRISRNSDFAQAIFWDCQEYERMFAEKYDLYFIEDVRYGISEEL